VNEQKTETCDPRGRPATPVTLPHFWDNDTDLWFMAIEDIFLLHDVTEERDRFELSLGSLDLRHLQKVRHVLQDLHKENPYIQIKLALSQAYSVSRRKQIDELLYHTSLDHRPTELLAHMRELLGQTNSPESLEKLFLDRLPKAVRRIVVASHSDSLDELAERADRVIADDAIMTAANRDQDPTELTTSSLHCKVDALAESFQQLAQTLDTFSRDVGPTSFSNTPQRYNAQYTRRPFSSTSRLPPVRRSLHF